ncbi:MAG: hypothetical protein QF371_09205, partial [Flavobacteriales bacterium]|nr:hypothetical protein [Flavobacteriales bacterium]
FVIVRYLKFPLVSFVNAVTEKKVKRYMIGFVIIVVLPSAWIFYGLVKETIFQGRAENFIAQNFEMEGTSIISKKITYTNSVSTIDIFIMNEPITRQTQEQLEHRMLAEGLENTILQIHQPKDVTNDIAGKLSKEVRVGILEDLYKKNERFIAEKDSVIQQLKARVTAYQRDSIPLAGISKEILILYPQLERISYAPSVEMRNSKLDTLATFLVKWKNGTSRSAKREKRQVLDTWLKQRLELDTLRIIEF